MSVSRSFPESAQSVRLARRFVAEQLEQQDPDIATAAVAAVSELATNSVLHASSEFSVTVAVAADVVRVEVTDYGPGIPQQRSPAASDRSGRGLNILESLTDDWGVSDATDSKTVWFTIALTNGDVPSVADGAVQSNVDAGDVGPAPANGRSIENPSAQLPDSVGRSDTPTASSPTASSKAQCSRLATLPSSG